MNKTLAINTIMFVAVVIGISAVAPAMAFNAVPDVRGIVRRNNS